MTALSEAEAFLLEQVRRGEADGWSQLVERFRGRLLSFARSRCGRSIDAEDIVQETFIGFLQGLPRFRGDASLETFLFAILRRRIIDAMRGRRVPVCHLSAMVDENARAPQFASAEPTASWYARRDEAHDAHLAALRRAIADRVETTRKRNDLRSLQIVEAVFYAQWPNKQVAEVIGVTENNVALIKHRWINDIRDALIAQLGTTDSGQELWQSSESVIGLFAEAWEAQRPSCPKRSTIGRFLLGTLDQPWPAYIDFHINRLGCAFCRANLDDLKRATRDEAEAARLQSRIMQSTIGLLRRD